MASLSQQEILIQTGPIYVGVVLMWGLGGALTMQVVQFYASPTRSSLVLKSFVAAIYVLELIHCLFELIYGWQSFVSGWGHPDTLINVPWAGLSQPILGGIISGSVQLFYAWRIWTMKSNSMIARGCSFLIIVVSLLSSVTAVTAGIMFCFVKDIAGEEKLTSAVNIWLGAGVAVDVFIAIVMTVILAQVRQSTPFKNTERLMTKLVIASIETGAVTAIVAAVELILFLHFPGLNYHLCPSLILSQLYSNTALASLNRRQKIRKGNGASGNLQSFADSRTMPFESHQLDLVSNSTDVENGTRALVSTVTEVHIDSVEGSKKNIGFQY